MLLLLHGANVFFWSVLNEPSIVLVIVPIDEDKGHKGGQDDELPRSDAPFVQLHFCALLAIAARTAVCGDSTGGISNTVM